MHPLCKDESVGHRAAPVINIVQQVQKDPKQGMPHILYGDGSPFLFGLVPFTKTCVENAPKEDMVHEIKS